MLINLGKGRHSELEQNPTKLSLDPLNLLSHPGIRLFLASFLSLFLELLLIRWVPSQVRIVAYYGNLMLMSAFLGLGCGTLLARRGLNLYRWFAPCLLLLILVVSGMSGVHFRQGPDELRFLFQTSTSTTAVPVVLIFVMNTLVFVPLGELIGNYIQLMSPLQAYSWDLGGAIVGTAIFGLFSYLWFSPVLGCIVVMMFYLIYCRGVALLIFTGIFFVSSLGLMIARIDEAATWSPYNYIMVKELEPSGIQKTGPSPIRDIETMRDPPIYIVEVNRDFYMVSGTLDGRRYTKHSRFLPELSEYHTLLHQNFPRVKEVLVVGAGAGTDVEAALLWGAEHVDAVEIDPVIIWIGHRYNASQPYKDPRVSIHNTDARAFFKQAKRKYDMVVFGFLDSQSLFSQMSNIRLDGYVYTHESFREAFGLLKPEGVMSISFFGAGKEWLVDRLISMVYSVTEATPMIYSRPTGQVIIIAGKGFVPKGPDRFMNYRRIEWTPSGTPEATDDWPYLYLRKRFIPLDYLVNMGVLLTISLLFVFLAGKRGTGIDLHFFFLGAGFLLLETKSITTISLYFGTTWFVSMIVILGVLIMVFLANLAASRLKRFSPMLYLPLVASVGFLYFFPTQSVLDWSFLSRVIYSLVIIPLPIFFAGLIFSSTFRESQDLSFAFGSNLLGAMIGGFVEYLGMVTGTQALFLIVAAFYLASLFVTLLGRRTLRASA